MRMAILAVGELHEPHTVNPSRNLWRVADDASPQFVPLAMFPKRGPLSRLDRQWKRACLLDDLGHFVSEIKVPQMNAAGKPFAIDACEISAGVVIDHILIRLSLLGAP